MPTIGILGKGGARDIKKRKLPWSGRMGPVSLQSREKK